MKKNLVQPIAEREPLIAESVVAGTKFRLALGDSQTPWISFDASPAIVKRKLRALIAREKRRSG